MQYGDREYKGSDTSTGIAVYECQAYNRVPCFPSVRKLIVSSHVYYATSAGAYNIQHSPPSKYEDDEMSELGDHEIPQLGGNNMPELGGVEIYEPQDRLPVSLRGWRLVYSSGDT